jgi:hypothetical protein
LPTEAALVLKEQRGVEWTLRIIIPAGALMFAATKKQKKLATMRVLLNLIAKRLQMVAAHAQKIK